MSARGRHTGRPLRVGLEIASIEEQGDGVARSTASVGRRGFLKGAAAGAAALVARGAPIAEAAQEPATARPATPAAPGNAQLRADTEQTMARAILDAAEFTICDTSKKKA